MIRIILGANGFVAFTTTGNDHFQNINMIYELNSAILNPHKRNIHSLLLGPVDVLEQSTEALKVHCCSC